MTQNSTYFRDKKRAQRKLDKELGIRYRGWEQMPGESFTEFKRRLTSKKATKLLSVLAMATTFVSQLTVIIT